MTVTEAIILNTKTQRTEQIDYMIKAEANSLEYDLGLKLDLDGEVTGDHQESLMIMYIAKVIQLELFSFDLWGTTLEANVSNKNALYQQLTSLSANNE